ncbi:MAG: 3-keto-5-aminohexanoate cleavage protein [Pseudoruegeria sp.]
MKPLPKIMVAPNGARRSKSDHPALPVTDAELIETAIACQTAGADGIHVHIRDAEGKHEIDAGHYRELLAQLREAVPNMYHQVTSESAERYSAAEQREMMRSLIPAHVSVAVREMVRHPSDWDEAQDFYEWAHVSNVDIQHILYSPTEVRNFVAALDNGRIPGTTHLIQLVQGSYANGSKGQTPLADYLAEFENADGMTFDWMLCAFGTEETANLRNAATFGGKARVGFENSFWNMDGSLADDNAMRVREVNSAIRDLDGGA